jgi:hypothetical protein
MKRCPRTAASINRRRCLDVHSTIQVKLHGVQSAMSRCHLPCRRRGLSTSIWRALCVLQSNGVCVSSTQECRVAILSGGCSVFHVNKEKREWLCHAAGTNLRQPRQSWLHRWISAKQLRGAEEDLHHIIYYSILELKTVAKRKLRIQTSQAVTTYGECNCICTHMRVATRLFTAMSRGTLLSDSHIT